MKQFEAKNIAGYACKVAHQFFADARAKGIELSQSKAMRLAWAIAYAHYGRSIESKTPINGRNMLGRVVDYDIETMSGKFDNLYQPPIKIDHVKSCKA